MNKKFCDICGREIEFPSEWSEYKLKKREYSFHERWWVRLDVHDKCWEMLCASIDAKRQEEK